MILLQRFSMEMASPMGVALMQCAKAKAQDMSVNMTVTAIEGRTDEGICGGPGLRSVSGIVTYGIERVDCIVVLMRDTVQSTCRAMFINVR